MARYCPNCGAANGDTDAFCHACAHALATARESPTQVAPAAETPASEPASTGSRYCPHCGAKNTVRDLFCHACAHLLTIAAGATTPAEPTPAAPPPSATTYHVGGEQQPSIPFLDAGRLPMAVIIGGVLAALLLVAGVGVALAVVFGDRDGGGPTPEPGPAGDLRSVDVDNIAVEVPAAWNVVKQDPDTIGVADPTARILWLRSGTVGEAFTLDSLQQRLLDKFTGEAPDARICAGPEAAQVPGGPQQARYFVICYTFIPQGGGQAARLSDAYYVGVDGSGTTVFVMQLTASPETLDEFAASVRQLPAPRWKLFGG